MVVGVVQEQHAERAKLYKQWKQYKFPIAQDSMTSLGLSVVPVPILLDEHGFVLERRPKPSNISELVETAKPDRQSNSTETELASDQTKAAILEKRLSADSNPDSWMAVGDYYLHESTIDSTKKAISLYETAIETLKDDAGQESLLGAAYFRLGVAYRALYDLSNPSSQNPDWFTKAATHWTNALALNPNQYIWRRRIQQYGPRQMKPYPFYDWVDQAKKDITDRGETPVELSVSLTGAEIAQPQRKFDSSTKSKTPDPDGKIARDVEQIVHFDATVVPQKIKRGGTARVHLRFQAKGGHWNNEADPMVVWLEPSNNGDVSKSSSLTHVSPQTATSDEVRPIEFEFKTNADSKEPLTIRGYALYYVCTSDNGQCLYRRQDFEIPIQFIGE